MRRYYLQIVTPVFLLLEIFAGAYWSYLRALVVEPAAGQIDWFWFVIVVVSGVSLSLGGWWLTRPYRIH